MCIHYEIQRIQCAVHFTFACSSLSAGVVYDVLAFALLFTNKELATVIICYTPMFIKIATTLFTKK